MEARRLHGVITPILTPLTPDERLDEASLRLLVDFLVEGGVDGLWVMGTTGEFAGLPEDQRRDAVAVAVDQARGRVPVVANVGATSTRLALRIAREAAAAGADALALTPPYYYPHSMDEMLVHFRAVKEAHPQLPLLVYNIPQTVKVNMDLATILQLAREGIVDGIKDSQNDLDWFRKLVLASKEAGLGERFRLLLGTRTLIDTAVQIGAHGSIPAVSNVAPASCRDAHHHARAGDWRAAARAQEVAIEYEALSLVARSGSANAASLSSMKQVLTFWGILAHPTVSRPLRPLAREEVDDLERRLSGMPGGRLSAPRPDAPVARDEAARAGATAAGRAAEGEPG